MPTWTLFTKLADTYVLLPAALLCMLCLASARAWRLTAVWAVLLGCGLALVAATKLAFVGWGIGSRDWNFTGISGHAMRAAAIAPVLFYLLAQNSGLVVRMLAIFGGITFGILIGISRLAVHVHSVSEVVTGCLLGIVISLPFLALLERSPRPAFPRHLLLAAALPLLAMTGTPGAPTEKWLERVALSLSGHSAPYTRNDLGYPPLVDGDEQISGRSAHFWH
ncbi:phosphatase PAP2 family protein [Noviherbaspirillum pedocola]|uniref:Phosphatase PAP2 family protein n=1 Tax=Noviherbaspirillum pedocola TaxID=2801341 RepID=A0A934SPH9_9BURK|nr:phosphatase PAP2 family protein [Noviherbaspirillum pedocola]MBK4734326.1 phosphatase PAP2 family protein [Noviherbaspirillum pedocola]